MSQPLPLTDQQWQALRGIKKRLISRENAEQLRRIAVFLGTDTEDGALVEQAADLLLDMRQALRGGRRNVRASRHWPEDDPRLS